MKNKKLCWRKLNEIRKPKEKIEARVSDNNGRLVMNAKKVSERWKQYFDDQLNVTENREGDSSAMGSRSRISKRMNELEPISEKEAVNAVANMGKL